MKPVWRYCGVNVWRYIIDMEAAWRRHGGGMEAAWRRHGGGMEKVWRRHGEGMEAIHIYIDLIGYTISNRTYQTFHFKPYILLDIRYQ